jgi:ABC-type glutathione transport system ATPase component
MNPQGAPMPAPPVVELRQIVVTYRKGPPWQRVAVPALMGVSLAIAAGETLGLVGESGSGKSTLGRVALGLVQPTRGEVLFDGRPLGPAFRRSGALAVVFQHPEWALNPRLRCGTSIAEPLHIQRRGSPAERATAVAQMLEQVGLDPALAQRYPDELSGGQRQRMAIARALITRPRFIVFDEAVSALDVSVQSQILNLIRRLQTEFGFAALFISHDLAATRYVAQHIGVLLRGELVETGPASRFYAQPEHAYSRALYATLD